MGVEVRVAGRRVQRDGMCRGKVRKIRVGVNCDKL